MGNEKHTRRHFTSGGKVEAMQRRVVAGEAVSAICEDCGVMAMRSPTETRLAMVSYALVFQHAFDCHTNFLLALQR